MLNSDDRRNLALARHELISNKNSRTRHRGALMLSLVLLGVVLAVAWTEGLLPRESRAQPQWQSDQRTFSVPYDTTAARSALGNRAN